MTELIAQAKDNTKYTSLAVFKSKEILDFKIEKVEREWDKKKLDTLKAKAQQLNLFQNSDNPFEVVQKLPYKFSYKFISDDGIERTMMIEDWEIGQLYWNCLKAAEDNETVALVKVRAKYEEPARLEAAVIGKAPRCDGESPRLSRPGQPRVAPVVAGVDDAEALPTG